MTEKTSDLLIEDKPAAGEILSWSVVAGDPTATAANGRAGRPREDRDSDGTPNGTTAPWILVVDDEPMIRATVRDILELDGYPVQTADNGATALTLLEPDAPGLIVLDMRMPVMDGWEFARALQGRGLDVPILVMTAAQNAHGWAREVGAAAWLGKPFQIDDLLAKVEELCPRDRGDAPTE